MVIRATFIGTDHYRGLRVGIDYSLQVLVDRVIRPNAYPIWDDQPRISYSDATGEDDIRYASWQDFWKSWKRIK